MLPMPGRHNVLNAIAAIAVAHELGLSDDTIRKALAGFGGVQRRFTKTGEWNGVTIIDDYGHHPVEIAAVLKAARESTNGKVIAVVQPHRFTRLQSLFEEFCTCFNDADTVIVADVYAAGEAPIAGIDRDHFVLGLRAHGHREVIPLQDSAALAGVVAGIAQARRLRRLPRRRQHHPMGLRAAGRIEGAGRDALQQAYARGHDAERCLERTIAMTSTAVLPADCAAGCRRTSRCAADLVSGRRAGGGAVHAGGRRRPRRTSWRGCRRERAGHCARRRLQSDRPRRRRCRAW